MLRTLEILARLHRRELDGERRQLAELDRRGADLEVAIGALTGERAREASLGASCPDGGGPFLDAYLEASRRREERLRGALAEITTEREATAERVRERLAAAKRYELLAARAAARAATTARRREQTELDELAASRRVAGRARED